MYMNRKLEGYAVVSSVASPQEGSNFFAKFSCSPYACIGFLQVLHLTSTVQRYATINCQKVLILVWIVVHLCVSNISSLSRVYPTSCLRSAGIGFSFPTTLKDGWLDTGVQEMAIYPVHIVQQTMTKK